MPRQSKPKTKKWAVHPKLRCFVAMAFGRDDTDAVYEQYTRKAIEAANMIPIRVDRVVHIDRIDAKIRAEIAKADIVVADLTYARPSVYWEAGYAEREIPVIYTCRSDHFTPQADDQYGNCQVHFDLRNANIITWSGRGNRTFQETLRKTLLYASRPIREDKVRQEQQQLDREDFSRRARSEQMVLIDQASLSSLETLGYKAVPERSMFRKKVGSTLVVLTYLHCAGSLTQQDWADLSHMVDRPGMSDFSTREEVAEWVGRLDLRKIDSIRRILLRPVLDSIPPRRVAKVFPVWQRADSFLHYSCPKVGNPLYAWRTKRKAGQTPLPSSSELIFIDRIMSLPEYQRDLIQVLSTAEKDNSPIVVPGRKSH